MVDIEKIHQKYNAEIDTIRLLASFKIHDIDRYVEQYRDKIKPSENPALKSAYNLLFTVRKQFKSLLEKTNPNSSITITKGQVNVIYENCVYALNKATDFIEKNIDFRI